MSMDAKGVDNLLRAYAAPLARRSPRSHRAAVADGQVRGCLFARLRRWRRGEAATESVLRFLQPPSPAPITRLQDAGRSVFRGRAIQRDGACGYDGQGSRLAHIPTGTTTAGYDINGFQEVNPDPDIHLKSDSNWSERAGHFRSLTQYQEKHFSRREWEVLMF